MSDRDPLFDRLDDAIDFLIETGNGSAQDDLPDWATDEGVQLLIDARERIRPCPRRPCLPRGAATEPGWYVARWRTRENEIIWAEPLGLADPEWTFIARIYPDG